MPLTNPKFLKWKDIIGACIHTTWMMQITYYLISGEGNEEKPKFKKYDSYLNIKKLGARKQNT